MNWEDIDLSQVSMIAFNCNVCGNYLEKHKGDDLKCDSCGEESFAQAKVSESQGGKN